MPFFKRKLNYHIFQIGFNRCGTSSFTFFFRKNGLKATHWKNGTLAVGMELAKLRGEKLLTYTGNYDIYTDLEKVNMWRLPELSKKHKIFKEYLKHQSEPLDSKAPIYAFKYYKLLDQQYTGSRFILNTRNIDRWVESRLKLNTENTRISYRSCRCGDKVHQSETLLAECWKQEWVQHIDEVTDYFKERPNDLLHFDIEQDTSEKLIHFFNDLSLNKRYWSKRNQSKS